MKVSLKRLDNKMYVHQFTKVRSARHDVVYARRDKHKSLFQKAILGIQGAHGEAVYGYMSISVVERTSLKIDPIELLNSINANQERGWTEISSVNDAKEWEDRFVKEVSQNIDTFSIAHAHWMNTKTKSAREMAIRCLNGIGHKVTVSDRIKEFESMSSEYQRVQCVRLAHFPGVIQIPDSEQEYLLACWAVMADCGQNNIHDLNPLENSELMWTIQIIVDRLLSDKDDTVDSYMWNLDMS